MNVSRFRFWVSSFAALAAALMLSDHLDLVWWQGFLLWLALDLMTASASYPDKETGSDS